MNEVVIKIIGNYSYHTNHCLGEGVYGKVYEGIQRESRQKIAVKRIDLNKLVNDRYLQNAILSEISLLKRFDHPNVVKFRDVVTSKNSLYIVTQYCKDGDLKQMMKKKRLTEDDVFKIIGQILLGFSQLVKEKIIHRDLKPANILINDQIYKIADFGFAKYVDNFGSQMLKSCVGSPLYMAPQILQRSQYTTKCDIWSIGVIFYEMMLGYPPWKAKDQYQLLKAIRSISITSILQKQKLSTRSNQFLQKCLVYHQEARISWNELFEEFMPNKLQIPLINFNFNTNIHKRSPYKQKYLPSANITSFTKLELNQICNKNKFIAPLTINPASTDRIHIDRVHTDHNLTTDRIQNPKIKKNTSITIERNLTMSPQKKKTVYRGKSPDQIKNLRNECIYKNFICSELLIHYSKVKQYFFDIYKYSRFLFILVNLIKMQSNFLLMQVNFLCKTNNNYDEFLMKCQKQNQSYIELEKQIIALIEKEDIYQKVKEEIQTIVGNKIDVNFQQRIAKVQNLLVESSLETATIIFGQVRMHAKYNKDCIHVQILDWILDILDLSSSKDKQSIDLNTLVKFEELQFVDYLNKVINKADKILLSNGF